MGTIRKTKATALTVYYVLHIIFFVLSMGILITCIKEGAWGVVILGFTAATAIFIIRMRFKYKKR